MRRVLSDAVASSECVIFFVLFCLLNDAQQRKTESIPNNFYDIGCGKPFAHVEFLVFSFSFLPENLTQSHEIFKGLSFAWQSALSVFPERSFLLRVAITTSATHILSLCIWTLDSALG